MGKSIEKGLATRQNIVAVATRMFSADGYGVTSIEAILLICGISRGALYHHFASKEAIFEAVLETVEADLAAAALKLVEGIEDPAIALKTGVSGYLAATRDTKIRQIVLVDAPTVVGWHKWREIDAKFGFGLLKLGLQKAASQGLGRAELVEVNAHMLLASMMEVALLVARAEDHPEQALHIGQSALDDMIDRMVAPS